MTLSDILLTPAKRPQVVADSQRLLDEEVSNKDGVSGLAVKGAYATVKKVQPGKIQSAVDSLIDGFVTRLNPFWSDFEASGGGTFGDYLVKRGDEVSDALLGVTDERAAASENGVVKKAYEKLRPNAKKNVTEALPRLGELIQRHAS